MDKFLNKQWKELSEEEQIYFLENSTINVSSFKNKRGNYMGALVSKDKKLIIACSVDENNEVYVQGTAKFRSMEVLEKLKEK